MARQRKIHSLLELEEGWGGDTKCCPLLEQSNGHAVWLCDDLLGESTEVEEGGTGKEWGE
jgi:hypothetical protein